MTTEYLIILLLLITGSALGSFAGASMWRLRSRQLVEDKRDGEDVNPEEYAALLPLSKATVATDRSRCLHCGHTLAWYDLIPLFSWIVQRGKCRYCGAFIGFFEPLIEAGVALAFIMSYLLWPTPLSGIFDVTLFILWLVGIVLLAILFAYDAKWFLLPDVIVFPLIGVAALTAVLRIIRADDMLLYGAGVFIAVLVLSGLYLFLWYVSRGQWVGFGDVKLGLGLALLLADWRLALLALFLANLIGTLIVLPGILLGKLGRKAQVPFGPLLIAGAFIAMLTGERIVALYFDLLF